MDAGERKQSSASDADAETKLSATDAGRRRKSSVSSSKCRSRPVSENRSFLLDEHLAVLEGAREEATLVLRNFYKVK